MGDEFKIFFQNDSGKTTTINIVNYWESLTKDYAKSMYVWGSYDNYTKSLLQNMPSVSTFGDKIICEPDAIYVRQQPELEPEGLNPPKGADFYKLLEEQKTKPKALNQPFNGQSKFTPDEPMNIDEELFNQAVKNYVDRFLKKNPGKKSVLADKGSDFLKAANEYSMVQEKTKRKFVDPDKKPANPFLLAGIAMHESACGTSDKATDGRNNIGGFAGMSFSSVEDSIYYLGGLIDLNRQKGRESLSVLAKSGAYCAKSAAGRWTTQVSAHANAIREEYNRLLAEKNEKK